MVAPLIVAGGAAVLGGLLSAGGAAAKRAAERKAALRKARALGRVAQSYNPYFDELRGTEYTLDGTALDQFKADPQAVQAQRQALADLQAIYNQGGLTAEDRAALAEIEQQQLTTESNQRNAILQQAAMRGGLTQGATLAAELGASQNASNQARMQGLRQGAISRQRALDALSRAYDAASNLRGQQSGEDMRVLAARDAVNAFNANARRSKIQDVIALQQIQNGAKGQQINARSEADMAKGAAIGGLLRDVGQGIGKAGAYGADYMKGQDVANKAAQAAEDAKMMDSITRSYNSAPGYDPDYWK